ncbi:hypothetical protein SPAN111604_12975 [Sphingomonas antarctica]
MKKLWPAPTKTGPRTALDRWGMLGISLTTAAIIAAVLYFAGAFMRSTG